MTGNNHQPGGHDARPQPERNQLMTTHPDHRVFTIDPADPLVESRIQDALTACNLIAVTWCIEDIQGIRPELSADQCWEVLEQAKDHHDAEIGINWSVLSCHADMLFGDTPETDESEEA
jgi:hypothetical protein